MAHSNQHGFVVLCVGRLSASHKADLRPLIAAFLTMDGLPAVSTLILAGDDTQGNIAGSLGEFADSFVSSNKVVVMPNIPDTVKAALLKTADVALCMSDTFQETFGISVLEAMAAGLPVVAPSWDGYRDLRRGWRDGIPRAHSHLSRLRVSQCRIHVDRSRSCPRTTRRDRHEPDDELPRGPRQRP